MANDIKEVRRLLDCEIRSFCEFLNISKSTLHCVEQGTYGLPPSAKEYFRQLQDQLLEKEDHSQVYAHYLATEQAELEAYKAKEQIQMADQLSRLKYKLSSMEADYRRSLAVLEKLSYINVTATGNAGELQRNWLDIHIHRHTRILQKNGLVKQWEVKRKIEGLGG